MRKKIKNSLSVNKLLDENTEILVSKLQDMRCGEAMPAALCFFCPVFLLPCLSRGLLWIAKWHSKAAIFDSREATAAFSIFLSLSALLSSSSCPSGQLCTVIRHENTQPHKRKVIQKELKLWFLIIQEDEFTAQEHISKKISLDKDIDSINRNGQTCDETRRLIFTL